MVKVVNVGYKNIFDDGDDFMEYRLLEGLLENKLITKDYYKNIITIKNENKENLVEILIGNNFISEKILYDFIKTKFKIKSIEIEKLSIPNNVIKILPRQIVKKYNLIPFAIKDDKLYVAMSDPLNLSIIEDIEFITKKRVIPYIERKNKIFFAIENYYSKQLITDTLKSKYSKENTKSQIDIDTIENTPIEEFTNSIINRAINEKASDIHLEPFKEHTIVRFRVNGILRKEMLIPNEVYSSVCTRIKIKSRMDISKKMLPQDGKINYILKDKEVDLRISSIPTLYGEKIVIRILYKIKEKIYLNNLVFDVNQRKIIKNIIRNTSGIILVTGPTGSGKTTTLCSILNELNNEDKNIVTIEDPVEYDIYGINQVNVNNKSGLTFSRGLRSLLRQDPDIIMIGEIRDEETAEIAVKAAITGHLVLSTLHTKDASSAVIRLMDMKVPSYLLGDSLIAILAQRLIREICPTCKERYTPSSYERKVLCLCDGQKLYKGRGCKACNYTGYAGRRAIFEIMDIDSYKKDLIRNGISSRELKRISISKGMTSLYHNCKMLVTDGITTFEELIKVFYENI